MDLRGKIEEKLGKILSEEVVEVRKISEMMYRFVEKWKEIGKKSRGVKKLFGRVKVRVE